MAVLDFLSDFKTQVQGGWYYLCILATFVVMLLYGLFYGIAHAFSLENIKRSAKSEILQAIATLLMIVVLATFVKEIETSTITNFLGTESFVMCGEKKIMTEDIESTFDIINCRLVEQAKALSELLESAVEDDKAATYMFFINWNFYMVGAQVWSFAWIKSWYDYVELIRVLIAFTTPALIGVNAMLALTGYIKANMLTIYLPVGLILRAFKFTRGIGAFFIAVGIGFYFIFPVLFVLNDPGFEPVESMEGGIEPYKKPSCFPTFSGTVTAAVSASDSSAAVSTATKSKEIGSVSKFYSYITINVFIAFAITLILVRYMMYILGGEAYTIMSFIAKVI